MITNCKVDLNEEQRRQVARNVFGSNKGVTRKEVNMLVAQLFEILTGDTHAEQLDTPIPARQEVQQDVARDEATRGGVQPAQPNNASYMRGWNAVGAAVARAGRRFQP